MGEGIPPNVPKELDNVQCDSCGEITSGYAKGQQYPTPPNGPLVIGANEQGQVFFSDEEAAAAGIDLAGNEEHKRKYGFSHGRCPKCVTGFLEGKKTDQERSERFPRFRGSLEQIIRQVEEAHARSKAQ